ncbi:MAG: U32 family peptidase [Clostridiales bacterium]|nr:U32 family peptidase [Clostridiales bacterium]
MQIVAPAGSFEGLKASVNGGANAVYLGMPSFGARAKAENFDAAALKKAVEYAHLFGVKVFVTLNTLIKDSEMDSAVEAAKYAYSVGVDAAIVQDLRFIKRLRKELPDFILHASTQMGVHNALGAKKLLELGIKRAVLARETLPADIAEIKKTGIEIEFFVQGALCVCFSGNCYFSSLASSYSGNRGKCMQLCRKPYTFGGKKGYFLSAKDLCLYNDIKRLEELGVDAIKIEGRMRSNEYAYTATSVYNSGMPTSRALDELKRVFNRGDYCNGYLDRNAPFQVIYPKIQGNIGRFVGKITQVKGNRLTVPTYTPHKDDGFKILRGGNEICGASVRDGVITASGNVKTGDELRLTLDGALAQTVKDIQKNIDIDISVTLKAGVLPQVILKRNDTVVEVSGDFVPQSAVSRALTAADIERAFYKVGEYPFEPTVKCQICDDIFMPVSALNELRRKAYLALYNAILSDYKIKRSELSPSVELAYNRFIGKGNILMVERADQIDDEILSLVDFISLNPRDYGNFTVPKINKPVLLNLPVISRGDDTDIIKRAVSHDGIYGVISNNLYSLNITDKPVLLGTGHNIIGSTDMPHIKSFEADTIDGNAFAYVFGYAPVMTLCHCPYGKCVNCSGDDSLTDDCGRTFKLRRFKSGHCYWQLLNCTPHYLLGGKDNFKNKFFDCTELDREQIIQVLNGEYRGPFTRGNVNKGLK